MTSTDWLGLPELGGLVKIHFTWKEWCGYFHSLSEEVLFQTCDHSTTHLGRKWESWGGLSNRKSALALGCVYGVHLDGIIFTWAYGIIKKRWKQSLKKKALCILGYAVHCKIRILPKTQKSSWTTVVRHWIEKNQKRIRKDWIEGEKSYSRPLLLLLLSGSFNQATLPQILFLV